jgi:hypothetical protein
MTKPKSLTTVVLVALAVMACSPGGVVSEHDVVQEDASPLRDEFNAARNRLRAVFIASPT